MINKLKSQPCADCGGIFDPVAMDFDHRGDKRESVSQMVAYGYTVVEILAEVAKCDVVCANCHRVRTKLRKLQGTVISKSSIPSRRPKKK